MKIPEKHDCTSCNDTNLANAHPNSSGYMRCIRCTLLKAKDNEAFANELEVDSISMNPDTYLKLTR